MLGINEGVKVETGTIVPCQSTGCLDCKMNYQICVCCNTLSGYYLDGTTCKTINLLSPNQGINSLLGTIAPCMQKGCRDCKANYQVCVACDTANGYCRDVTCDSVNGYYRDGTTCKTQSMLGINQGINTALQTITSCRTAGCLDCK